MRNMLANKIHWFIREEKGQILVMAVVMVLLGGLMIPPMLQFVNDTEKLTINYKEKAVDIYAADAGIEWGTWHARWDYMREFRRDVPGGGSLLHTGSPGYSPYNYDFTWKWTLTDAEQVNNMDVDVAFRNIWLPVGIDDFPNPEDYPLDTDPVTAEQIVSGGTMIVVGELQPSGDAFSVQFIYNGDDDLKVNSIGVWLPPGFAYNPGSCTLDDPANSGQPYYCDPTAVPLQVGTMPHGGGGTAIIWDFVEQPVSGTPMNFSNLPGVDTTWGVAGEFTHIASIEFDFVTGLAMADPPIIAWIDFDTSGALPDAIPYAWDADMKILQITSQAGLITIDSHVAQASHREMSGARQGDYAAVGNGLLGGNASKHDVLHEYSAATVYTGNDTSKSQQVPANATLDVAYLYWAGWMDYSHYNSIAGGASYWDTVVFSDNCDNFVDDLAEPNDGNWIDGADWNASGSFTGQHACGGWQTEMLDDCSDFIDDGFDPLDAAWDHNLNWDINSGMFRGHDNGAGAEVGLFFDPCDGTFADWTTTDVVSPWDGPYWSYSSGLDCYYTQNGDTGWLELNTGIDTSVCTGIVLRWEQDDYNDTPEAPDCLVYELLDKDNNWIAQGSAFCDDNPASPYEVIINDPQFMHPDFKIRFGNTGDSGHTDYLLIWDIYIGCIQPTDFLTMTSDVDLTSALGIGRVSWTPATAGDLENTDCIEVYFRDGAAWVHQDTFCANGLTNQFENLAPFVFVPPAYLNNDFRVQFRLGAGGWQGADEYCYIDDVRIERCTVAPAEAGRYLELDTDVDLTVFSPTDSVYVGWNQSASAPGTLSFFISNDGGATWSGTITAFANQANPVTPYLYELDPSYFTNDFRIKYKLEGSGWICEIDDIKVGTYVPGCDSLKLPNPDTCASYGETAPTDKELKHVFEDCARINRVMFYPEDHPVASGTLVQVEYHPRTNDIRWEPTEPGNSPGQWYGNWSYACKSDVTEIIRSWIVDPSINIQESGAGTYAVGHVVQTNQSKPGYQIDFDGNWDTASYTGYPLGYPAGQYLETGMEYDYCYAGWSLVLVYTSPDTAGHQVIVYDDMLEEAWGPGCPGEPSLHCGGLDCEGNPLSKQEGCNNDNTYENPDFDEDCCPGGTIRNFLIPPDITTDPGRITAFVVEGDAGIAADRIQVNGHYLVSNWDNSSYNVWDSDTLSAHSVAGVDIDTFVADAVVLPPNSTTATVDLWTRSDGFIMPYLIVSFESEIITPGNYSYTIR